MDDVADPPNLIWTTPYVAAGNVLIQSQFNLDPVTKSLTAYNPAVITTPGIGIIIIQAIIQV